MGAVVSIQEAFRLRHRRRTSALNARCREVIVESIAVWRAAQEDATPGDRVVCRDRVRVLGELLAATCRLS
jgi:hypothetical protein